MQDNPARPVDIDGIRRRGLVLVLVVLEWLAVAAVGTLSAELGLRRHASVPFPRAISSRIRRMVAA